MELEEKERQRREALLRAERTIDPPRRSAEPVVRPPEPVPVAAAAAAAPAAGKYVPRFRRESAVAAPPPEPDRSERWGRSDDRPPQSTDRWARPDDRRSSIGGGSRLPSSSSSWSSRRG